MSHLKTETFIAGQRVFSEGEFGDGGYIILSGKMLVHKVADGRPFELAVLGDNDLFGEVSLIMPGPRTASVTALEETQVIHLSQAQFRRRLCDLDPIMKMAFEIVATRFRSTLRSIGSDAVLDVPTSGTMRPEFVSFTGQLKLEADIRRGLAEREFDLHYQPIVNLETGAVAGYEGLMRWNHRSGKCMAPDTFLPSATASGLLPRFTRLALRRACADIRTFCQQTPSGAPCPFVTVNVCASDLKVPRFYSFLASAIKRYDVAPGMLKLEITETSLMQDIATLLPLLARLKDLGVQLVIDDFGTGYSSMSYLAQLPVSTLKVDRSFVSAMIDCPNMRKVTFGILRLAEELDVQTVGEGIETKRQAKMLDQQNCTFGQGFLMSRPVPREAVLDMIAEGRVGEGAIDCLQARPALRRAA